MRLNLLLIAVVLMCMGCDNDDATESSQQHKATFVQQRSQTTVVIDESAPDEVVYDKVWIASTSTEPIAYSLTSDSHAVQAMLASSDKWFEGCELMAEDCFTIEPCKPTQTSLPVKITLRKAKLLEQDAKTDKIIAVRLSQAGNPSIGDITYIKVSLDRGTVWQLSWADEFESGSVPNPEVWSYDLGFVRNEELQWYKSENARVENGLLILEGRKERVLNPNYDASSTDWRKKRQYAEYTSAGIKTAGKKEWQYGRLEVRAKIPTASGAWPAIWTLGRTMEWPSNGEVDILEFYKYGGVSSILANLAWGTDTRWQAKWNTKVYPYTGFLATDAQWASKFHTWNMEWTQDYIRIYLDNVLLNETLMANTINGKLYPNTNPFRQPHYMILNLAIGSNGGTPDNAAFPLRYEIDYVRLYEAVE